jgi:hypothetical protein
VGSSIEHAEVDRHHQQNDGSKDHPEKVFTGHALIS